MKNIANKCDQRLSQSLTSLLSKADQMMSTTGLSGCPPLICQTTQTTQTSLSSAALQALPKALGAQPQQPITSLVISPASLTITTTTTTAPKISTTTPTTNNRKDSHHSSKNKHLVVNRTNGLYEGSHIHFSPIDNKPLCSYSTKLCKQRRINGYAFCIRHILEDPSAPFRQCKHVAKYNQQKCSNAIPANEDRQFCNSHMQIAGMAPKKERKDKKASNQSVATNQLNPKTNGICQTINTNIKCVSSVGNGFALNSKQENPLKNGKFTNFDAFIKPSIKLNGTTNTVNAITIQKLNDNLQRKSSDKCVATTEALPLNETSFSSHSNNFKLNNINSNQIKTEINTNCNKNKANDIQKNTNASKPKPKRKKKEKKTVDKFVFARKKKSGDNLFNYHIWSESDDNTDEEELTSDQIVRRHLTNDTSVGDETFPLIFGTLSTNIVDLEPNELKNELISQKWLLKDLIDVRKKDFAPQLESTRAILKTLNTTPMKRNSYLDYKLSESSRRSEQSIRKGICCYASDETRCRRSSLPFTRHCIEHILYNVDQLLFARCTAKCAKTMTLCSRPTFDIINEDPLCSYHQMVGSEVDERSVSPTTDLKNKKRRKTKPMALTRVSRRGKKRRKGPNGKDIPVNVEDSIDSRLSIGSIDDDSLHSHSDTNDISINIMAQKPDHNQSPDIVNHTITTAIPQTTTSVTISSVVHPDITMLRLPPLLPPIAHTCDPPVVPMGPVVLDHSMPPPPPLEPTEEALVASIVADLPQLTTDADFTEVLNKIPDDFSDFLLEHPNGDIPSTEETEALEQALAMVNKDVQNLVAVAGMNGSSNSGAQMSDFGGQSDIFGFTNWFGSLTSEQRQQLNGLIDGAIASNSLSPILKNACDAYPSQTILPSSAPPIIKNSATYVTAVHSQTNAFPAIYPNSGSIPQQEFVPISAPVPTLLNNNLLMNGLSSHPS